MTNNGLNILCLDNDSYVSEIVSAVCNSKSCKINTVHPPVDVLNVIGKDMYDLLIVDNVSGKIPAGDFEKINKISSGLFTILIDQNNQKWESGLDNNKIHYLANNELAEKLPVIINEIAEKVIKERQGQHNYLSQIKDILFETGEFAAILDIKSEIIFINRTAEKLLEINGKDYSGALLTDFIVDGAKVWKYIIDKVEQDDETIKKYSIKFKDIHNNEYDEIIHIKKLNIDKPYIFIQSSPNYRSRGNQSSESEYQLLDKFADSIANELLNPVNIISGRLQLLQSELSGKEQFNKNLLTLEKQVERINETIAKLLTFARLKQDTIPQKIQLNELLKGLLLEPSISRLIDKDEVKLNYKFAENIPAISGLTSHLNLLFKTIIELSFNCLGSGGRLTIETSFVEQYLKQNWVKTEIKLEHSHSIFGSEAALYSYLAKEDSRQKVKSIEAAIINRLIDHYHGTYKIVKEKQNIEILIILFPISESI
jgi:signal transduction histidine kinase